MGHPGAGYVLLMTMNTSGTPYGKDKSVTDGSSSKTTNTAKTDDNTDKTTRGTKSSDQAKGPDTPKAGNLAPAGESGDPAVQKLLAEREIHRLNAGPAEDPEAEARRDVSNQAIDEIDKKLAELGFTAK